MDVSFVWPNDAKCAVSLTYDDGLPVHYRVVAPLLQDANMAATFYPPILSDLAEHPDQWRALVDQGHELGNHSIFHPCRRMPVEEYLWLDEDFDLCAYSPARLRAELRAANVTLQLIDGQTERTYGNTCCHTTIGQGEHEQPMDPFLRDMFVAARGALSNMSAKPDPTLNLLNVGCMSADGRSLAELVEIVDRAQHSRGWVVLMIHGVGSDTHELHVDAETHAQFIAWLAQHRAAVWTAPFITVAKYIRHWQTDRVHTPS